MWDTDSYDVTGYATGGPTTVTLGIPTGGDCLVHTADILSVETGAVRTIQSVPTLGGWGSPRSRSRSPAPQPCCSPGAATRRSADRRTPLLFQGPGPRARGLFVCGARRRPPRPPTVR